MSLVLEGLDAVGIEEKLKAEINRALASLANYQGNDGSGNN
jgi:hypothetical protein